MRVLYVTSPGAPDAAFVLSDLVWLEPALEIRTATGVPAALAEIRAAGTYVAVFLAPTLPQLESLALISDLRRDRTPVAIVAIITEEQRDFLAPAVTAGADDVLVLHEDRLVAVEDTLRRVRLSRHLEPPRGQPRLRVLYAGRDPLAWDHLQQTPFACADRTDAAADGACALAMSGHGLAGEPCDLLVVDESPGAAHPLQVVKWVKAHEPELPVVVLTSPAAGDIGTAALELGADEVVTKAGAYRGRLTTTLHRFLLRRLATGGSAEPPRPPEPPEPPLPPAVAVGPSALEEFPPEAEPASPADEHPAADEQRERLTEALRFAEVRMGELKKEAASAAQALEALRKQHDHIVEAHGYERALRDRDREELASFRKALQEERERRIVLEGTLRHTEDRVSEQVRSLEDAHAATRRRLEAELAAAADRLHQVANDTQQLQARLEHQLAAQAAERDRLAENPLVAYALLTLDGRLTRCSQSFASLFGYATPDDAMAASRAGPFAGTPDHARVVDRLQSGQPVERAESTARRADGRPFRVLTSAVLLPAAGGDPIRVERLFVDLSDRAAIEVELRLARRLEAAGRLAAEMAPEIEAALPAISAAEAPGADETRRATTLVRQLLAFSRRQARPAGFLSLNDAIARTEPLLRQVGGDGVDLQIHLGEIEAVTAGEDDIEHLLVELALAAAACLPYGGAVTIATAPVVSSEFVLSTRLSATAAGYGALPVSISSSFARTVARCGGTVGTSGEAGRTSTLHVVLPC